MDNNLMYWFSAFSSSASENCICNFFPVIFENLSQPALWLFYFVFCFFRTIDTWTWHLCGILFLRSFIFCSNYCRHIRREMYGMVSILDKSWSSLHSSAFTCFDEAFMLNVHWYLVRFGSLPEEGDIAPLYWDSLSHKERNDESSLYYTTCFLLSVFCSLSLPLLGLGSKSTSLSPEFCVRRPRQYNTICWK